MAKQDKPEQFTVTLDEFAGSVPQVETRRAFVGLMRKEAGRKPREQWQALFDRFLKKPAGVPWETWRKTGR